MYSIGSSASVHARFKSNNLFSVTGYDDVFIEGVVVKTPSYVSYDAVTLRTDNPDFPLSIIPLSKVVGYVPSSTKKTVETHLITSGANTYTVTVDSGKVACSCVGFQFRRYCKHSDQFKK
jgi:hypothetical protein